MYEQAAAAGDIWARRRLQQLSINEALSDGRFSDALRLQQERVEEVEANELTNDGKAGQATAEQLVVLSRYGLFAREPAKSLAASERAEALQSSDLAAEINRAHALMFLGRADNARTAYLAQKDKPMATADGKTRQQVIADDFAAFRKAGLIHPQMAEIEKALGIGHLSDTAARR